VSRSELLLLNSLHYVQIKLRTYYDMMSVFLYFGEIVCLLVCLAV